MPKNETKRIERKQIKTRALRAILKRAPLDCALVVIGTGKFIELGFHGDDAAMIACCFERDGFVRSAMCGAGRNQFDLITFDKIRIGK